MLVETVGGLVDVLGKMRYELTELSVFQNAPEEAGVYTLLDKDGIIIFMEWADNIGQQLHKHVPGNELNLDLKQLAKQFSFFCTSDPSVLSKLYDRFVEKSGAPPACQKTPPQGSRLAQAPAPADQSQQEQTEYYTPAAPVDDLLDLAREECSKGHTHKAAEAAIKALTEAALIDDRTKATVMAKAHLVLGTVLLQKGRQAAIEEWRKAAELDPRGVVGRKANKLFTSYVRKIADEDV